MEGKHKNQLDLIKCLKALSQNRIIHMNLANTGF